MFGRALVRVVGMTFTDGYPDSLHELARHTTAGEPLPVVLRRNPDNEHDPNAVEVHAPLVGMIGHLPRDVAAIVAPFLDGGGRVRVGIHAVYVDPEFEDRPGVSINIERLQDAETPVST